MVLIIVGSCVAYVAGFLTTGRLNYRYQDWDRYTIDGEKVSWSLLAGLLWPAIVATGIVVAPIWAACAGAGAFFKAPTRKEVLAKRKTANDDHVAALERECLPPMTGDVVPSRDYERNMGGWVSQGGTNTVYHRGPDGRIYRENYWDRP